MFSGLNFAHAWLTTKGLESAPDCDQVGFRFMRNALL